jgi:hypothetical protein
MYALDLEGRLWKRVRRDALWGHWHEDERPELDRLDRALRETPPPRPG